MTAARIIGQGKETEPLCCHATSSKLVPGFQLGIRCSLESNAGVVLNCQGPPMFGGECVDQTSQPVTLAIEAVNTLLVFADFLFGRIFVQPKRRASRPGLFDFLQVSSHATNGYIDRFGLAGECGQALSANSGLPHGGGVNGDTAAAGAFYGIGHCSGGCGHLLPVRLVGQLLFDGCVLCCLRLRSHDGAGGFSDFL